MAFGGDQLQKFLQGLEFIVFEVVVDQQIGFGAMILEVINLAVKHLTFDQDIPAVVFGVDKIPHPQKGEIFGKVLQPVGNGLRRDGKPVFFGNPLRRLFQRIKAVVKGDGVQNDFEGIGFAFGHAGGKFFLAVRAIVQLDGFILLRPQAFFDDFGSLTVWTVNNVGFNCSILNRSNRSMNIQ